MMTDVENEHANNQSEQNWITLYLPERASGLAPEFECSAVVCIGFP